MKVLVTSYTFDKTAKTVTFTGYGSIFLDHILLITNVTSNIIIYSFASPTKGGTVATNVLTLTYDTSSMSNTDKLQIFYWDTAATQPIDDGAGSITVDNANLDVALSTRLKPADTLTAVTTVGTITNVVHIDDNSGNISVDDGGNSITVDAPVGTPVFARLSDGSATLIGQKAMSLSLPVTLASDQSAVMVENTLTEATGTLSGTGTFFTQTVTNYKWVNVQIDGILNATAEFSGSNDNITWYPTTLSDISSTVGVVHKTTTSDGQYAGPISCKYFRVRVISWVSGTITCTAEFSTLPAGQNSAVNVSPASVFSVSLAAETTKVIGTVNLSAGQTLGTVSTITNVVHVDDNSGNLSIDDGGNSITVDGTVAIGAGSAVIGHVIADSGSTTAVTGNVTVVQGTASNLKVDASGVAVPITDNSGSLTVDNGGTFAVQATLAAETTKVIGVTRTSDGAGNLITSNSSTYTAKFGLDSNLLGTLGTAFTTAGKVDVKAADGDVFVRQATASNLNATVVGTGTFATQSTLAAETTKVIGTVNLATGSNVIGALTANQSVNTAQVNGATTVASVTGIQDVMPRKRTGSTGLSPNYAASHITTKTTTNVTASTAYISSIAISVSAAGTSQTLVIQNKEGTPKIIYTAGTAIVIGNVYINFTEPILMTSGIDIVTAGTTAGTQDVFVTYWQ